MFYTRGILHEYGLPLPLPFIIFLRLSLITYHVNGQRNAIGYVRPIVSTVAFELNEKLEKKLRHCV